MIDDMLQNMLINTNDAISLEFLENDRLLVHLIRGIAWSFTSTPVTVGQGMVDPSERLPKAVALQACVCVPSLSQKKTVVIGGPSSIHEGSRGITRDHECLRVSGSCTSFSQRDATRWAKGSLTSGPPYAKMWRCLKRNQGHKENVSRWRGLSGNPDIFSATLGNINRRWSMCKNSNRTSLTWWNLTFIEWSWGWVRICRIFVAEALAND
jgi:hypothetical protein